MQSGQTGSPAQLQGQPVVRAGHFEPGERLALSGLYGGVALLHMLGIGLLLVRGGAHPALLGTGFAAYMLGMRHAFDADHIAAIDDTVRFMLQKGRRPLGVGFFFSLGHSSIVLVLATALALSASTLSAQLPALRELGGLIGAGVAGVFLLIMGLLNLRVLLDLTQLWRKARHDAHGHAHVEQLLARRGLLNRLFGALMRRFAGRSWHMYPLGMLFGLGFDTASEIGLLAITAGAASGGVPLSAALALPLLFAAGMSLMDTTDGVLMTGAYRWAFVNPLRKLFYNLGTTSLTVLVALVIGGIDLLQFLIRLLGWHGPWAERVAGLDLGTLGFVILALFVLAWALSVALWKLGRFERHAAPHPPHAHEHVHADGTRHRHPHFH